MSGSQADDHDRRTDRDGDAVTERPTDASLKVLVFAASLRAGSLNQELATLAARAATASGAIVDRASMSDFDVPSYDGDVETESGIPEGAQAFEQRLRANDAFIIAAPEYNGSMPGMLKNLIDWTSRF